MEPTQIKDLNHLIELCDKNSESGVECFIALNGGLRSSKVIWYDGESLWSVMHEIDGTEEDDLTLEQLKINTNIIDALEKGGLYAY